MSFGWGWWRKPGSTPGFGAGEGTQAFDDAPAAAFNFVAEVVEETTLSVQFTDTSTNAPLFWFWDFGDGSTSNEPNPLHVFADAEATYDVRLTVRNLGGTTFVNDSVAAP